MDNPRSSGDTLFIGFMAFAAGCIAGLVVLLPVGWLAYTLIEQDCTGEYMCGLGAAIWAALIALAAGVVSFVAAASRTLTKRCPFGQRLGPGLVAFLGLPLFFILLFSLTGF